jgi:hypothetical protein
MSRNEPPNGEERRKPENEALRKLFEDLKEVQKKATSQGFDIQELQVEMRQRTTTAQTLLWLGALGAVAISAQWAISRVNVSDIKTTIDEKLETNQRDTDTKLGKSDLLHQVEHRAIYDSLPKRRPNTILETPPKKLDGGK